jgi:hypothetical protein
VSEELVAMPRITRTALAALVVAAVAAVATVCLVSEGHTSTTVAGESVRFEAGGMPLDLVTANRLSNNCGSPINEVSQQLFETVKQGSRYYRQLRQTVHSSSWWKKYKAARSALKAGKCGPKCRKALRRRLRAKDDAFQSSQMSLRLVEMADRDDLHKNWAKLAKKTQKARRLSVARCRARLHRVRTRRNSAESRQLRKELQTEQQLASLGIDTRSASFELGDPAVLTAAQKLAKARSDAKDAMLQAAASTSALDHANALKARNRDVVARKALDQAIRRSRRNAGEAALTEVSPELEQAEQEANLRSDAAVRVVEIHEATLRFKAKAKELRHKGQMARDQARSLEQGKPAQVQKKKRATPQKKGATPQMAAVLAASKEKDAKIKKLTQAMEGRTPPSKQQERVKALTQAMTASDPAPPAGRAAAKTSTATTKGEKATTAEKATTGEALAAQLLKEAAVVKKPAASPSLPVKTKKPKKATQVVDATSPMATNTASASLEEEEHADEDDLIDDNPFTINTHAVEASRAAERLRALAEERHRAELEAAEDDFSPVQQPKVNKKKVQLDTNEIAVKVANRVKSREQVVATEMSKAADLTTEAAELAHKASVQGNAEEQSIADEHRLAKRKAHWFLTAMDAE